MIQTNASFESFFLRQVASAGRTRRSCESAAVHLTKRALTGSEIRISTTGEGIATDAPKQLVVSAFGQFRRESFSAINIFSRHIDQGRSAVLQPKFNNPWVNGVWRKRLGSAVTQPGIRSGRREGVRNPAEPGRWAGIGASQGRK